MGLPIPTTNNSLLTFDSDAEAIRVLSLEGRKLKYIAIKIWRLYLSSYSPNTYAVHKTGVLGKRTGKSLQSIKLGKVKKIGVDDWGIELTYLNDLAYHDSVINRKDGRKHAQGHSIMLISQGWKAKKGKNKNVERFGYYEGFDYLGQVQREYETVKDKRVTLDIQWLGKKNFTRAIKS